MIKKFTDFSPDEIQASNTLIRRGYFRHLFLGRQKEIYDMFHTLKHGEELGALLSRKQGKSFSTILLSIQFCLQHPNSIVKYCCITLKAARELALPIFNELKVIIPPDCFPKLLKSELKYIFPNGSFIHLVGLDPDNVDGARGSRADLAVFDEAGFIEERGDNFNYAINSVILPMMITSPHNKTIWITTPSNTTTHPFMRHIVPRLVSSNHYITYDIYSSPFMTPETIATLQEKYKDDPMAWDREYLCKSIPNKQLQVTPEFDPHHIIEQLPPSTDVFNKPIKFDVYIGVDTGLTDNTAIVAGYWHYSLQQFIVCYEFTCKRPTIPEIAQHVKNAHDAMKYLQFSPNHVHTTIDCFEIVGNTLRVEYGLVFHRPKKRAIPDTISVLRQFLKNNKILIHHGCISLIHELGNALWEDKPNENLQIERTELGHADSLMALAYILRFVNTNYIPSEDIEWNSL